MILWGAFFSWGTEPSLCGSTCYDPRVLRCCERTATNTGREELGILSFGRCGGGAVIFLYQALETTLLILRCKAI